MNPEVRYRSPAGGAICSLRKIIGYEIARVRRNKANEIKPANLPPQLRSHPQPGDFVSADDLTAIVPVTLYWGMERNVELDGFKPRGIPHWLGRFDWVVGFEYGWADTNRYPRSVFCEPSYLPALLSFMQEMWPQGSEFSALLVAGAGRDFLLSWHRHRMLKKLSAYFSCIYYEAKDVDVPDIRIMPIGLTEHYVRSNASTVIERAQTLNRTLKSGGDVPTVLAAWGAWWPGLDDLIPDRRRAREFAAASPLVTELQLSSDEWFEALSRFDFMLCPLGNGIQAPKLMEALLMGCVPIATRHESFIELRDQGVPMLLVDEWADVTSRLLQDCYSPLFREVMAFREKLLDLDSWWDFSFPCHAHESATWTGTD